MDEMRFKALGGPVRRKKLKRDAESKRLREGPMRKTPSMLSSLRHDDDDERCGQSVRSRIYRVAKNTPRDDDPLPTTSRRPSKAIKEQDDGRRRQVGISLGVSGAVYI